MKKVLIAFFVLGLLVLGSNAQASNVPPPKTCTGTSVQNCHAVCITPACRYWGPGTKVTCTYPDGPYTYTVEHTCGDPLKTPKKELTPMPGERPLDGEKK
ncbi:MAG: hypothetical protein L6Q57_00005 [Alphaproteobacteria bacterium]|nr:hypothetical protein [Alphaproteobacteria bacterium]